MLHLLEALQARDLLVSDIRAFFSPVAQSSSLS